MSGSVVDYYGRARQQMLRAHLKGRDIKDRRVLEVMGRLPRELFVPSFLRNQAYDDHPLLIGHEQTISQPYIVALMTEALQLEGRERVLEIGTGSGYQTAVLAELCAQVFTVERIAKLSLRASQVLERLGYANVRCKVANGAEGWPEEAPFDAILVTAGATSLPRSYHDQLIENGRLVIPLGPPAGQVLHRYTRRGDDWEDEELARVAFVPLIRES